MSALRARAPGKVNLCLRLGPRRPDGRHDLVTLVQAVSLADDLRLEPAGSEASADEVVCADVKGENLAARALAAFRAASGWNGPPVRLTIQKRVPVAAGMGGGSSDAAAALRLAAEAGAQARAPAPGRVTGGSARAAPTREAADLHALAAGLGSDVPALLEPGLALVTGAGERVRRLPPLAPFGVLVLPSPHRLATAAVYAEADRQGLPRPGDELEERRRALEAAVGTGAELSPELLVNDLEPAARALCPAIDAALADARGAGAPVALVSGSGPTVFGLYPESAGGRAAAQAAAVELAGRHPKAIAVEPLA